MVKTMLMGVGLGGWAAAVPPSPLRPLFHDVLHLYPLTGTPQDALSPHITKGHCWPMEVGICISQGSLYENIIFISPLCMYARVLLAS
ncbi:hypothetical protein EON65_22590 [archaeon]|nr:MAG: hypothetical protein EON65_22590 [archaeon]